MSMNAIFTRPLSKESQDFLHGNIKPHVLKECGEGFENLKTGICQNLGPATFVRNVFWEIFERNDPDVLTVFVLACLTIMPELSTQLAAKYPLGNEILDWLDKSVAPEISSLLRGTNESYYHFCLKMRCDFFVTHGWAVGRGCGGGGGGGGEDMS